jgi:hypothetical protein
MYVYIFLSEWLFLKTKWAISQLDRGENCILMRWWQFLLCIKSTRWVGFLCCLLVETTVHVLDMLLHMDTLSWFLTNQSLLFYLNTVYLVEKQSFFNLKFDSTWHLLTINQTWGEHANHCTTNEASMLTIAPPMRWAC